MKILLLLLAFCLINCSNPPVSTNAPSVVGQPSKVETTKNQTCTIDKVNNNAFISCPDGTSAFIYDGSNGSDGTNGIQGEKGDKGDTGEAGPQGEKGETGATGQNGTNGINGTDGSSAQNWQVFDPCKRTNNGGSVDFSKEYYGLNEVLIKTNDGILLGANQQNPGSGYVAISEVVINWPGGWTIGGSDGLYSCTFQYQTITIDNITKKCTWFPNSAPTPISFTDSNITCW